jgi:hypothetical protein
MKSLDISPATPSLSSAKLVVLALGGLALLITGLYNGVYCMQSFPRVAAALPQVAGYARTVICAALVFFIGNAVVTRKDTLMLSAGFVLTLVADWFLVATESQFLVGVGLFVVVHILLTVRHAQGFGDSLSPERRARTLRLLALTALAAGGVTALLLSQVMHILLRSGRTAIEVGYVLILTVSMWMGWGALIRGFYSRLNAWFIAIGITSFYLCDVSVGLAADLQGTTIGEVMKILVGFFYTPALLLLALSGYRWAEANVTSMRFLSKGIVGSAAGTTSQGD